MDKYAKLNERVLFSCIVEGFQADKDIVEWCKNDFCTWGRSIEMPDGRLKFKSLSKHYIVGNRQNGEWNLLIENATSSDMGQYKCTVTRRSDKLVYKINSNSANLTIMGKKNILIYLICNRYFSFSQKNFYLNLLFLKPVFCFFFILFAKKYLVK